MNELLDVVIRVYEYQRAYPTLVGTASGLETVRLVLQGMLPTPPIIATSGISLFHNALMRPSAAPSSRVLRPNGNTIPRNRAWRLAPRAARLRARLRGPNRAAPEFAGLPRSICMFGSWR